MLVPYQENMNQCQQLEKNIQVLNNVGKNVGQQQCQNMVEK